MQHRPNIELLLDPAEIAVPLAEEGQRLDPTEIYLNTVCYTHGAGWIGTARFPCGPSCDGWGARARTLITGSKGRCPTVGRLPKERVLPWGAMALLSAPKPPKGQKGSSSGTRGENAITGPEACQSSRSHSKPLTD